MEVPDPRAFETARRPQRLGLAFLTVCSLAGTIILVSSFHEMPTAYGFQVFSVFVTGSLVASVAYIAHMHIKNLHRYAHVGNYLHFINHTVRDALSHLHNELKTQQDIDQELVTEIIEGSTVRILDATASCFAVLTGRSCAVCIKELNEEQKISTIARDSVSLTKRLERDIRRNQKLYSVEESTPEYQIISGTQGYFLSNNVPKLHKTLALEHSSIFETDDGHNRRYAYRSVMVLPIRFPANFDKENDDPAPSYWGFLYLDSQSKNTFDARYSVDVGAAVADAIYTLFDQAELMARLTSDPQE